MTGDDARVLVRYQREYLKQMAKSKWTCHKPDGSINHDGKGEMRPWVPPLPPEYYMSDDQARRDLYRRLAGEVEARNVESRLLLRRRGRKATPPWKTEDVQREDQIIRFEKKEGVS